MPRVLHFNVSLRFVKYFTLSCSYCAPQGCEQLCGACLNLMLEHLEALLICLSFTAERLKISPSPDIRVDSSRMVTIAINFLQFEGSPEHPHTFFVNFVSSSTMETQRLGFVAESGIENGVASFNFTATENGTISVEADFTVGAESHRVTSNAVQLICKSAQRHTDIHANTSICLSVTSPFSHPQWTPSQVQMNLQLVGAEFIVLIF